MECHSSNITDVLAERGQTPMKAGRSWSDISTNEECLGTQKLRDKDRSSLTGYKKNIISADTLISDIYPLEL